MVSRNYVLVDSAEIQPSKFGLLNSKTLVTVADGDENEHWSAGIALEALTCNVDSRVLSVCNTSESVSSTEAGAGTNYYLPFFVQTEYTCSTLGFKENDYFGKAVRSMELCQGKAVEHEFWTGELAQQDTSTDGEGNPNPNKYLASTDAVDKTPTPGTGVKPRHALAILEKALADCGCGTRGFIHATRDVGSSLGIYLEKEDDALVTLLGNYVVAGTGYTGSGPNGTLPGSGKAWMYATGQVSALLGKVETTPKTRSEAVNTRINEVTVTAERPAAVTWDGCCHYAVLVDLSLDYS